MGTSVHYRYTQSDMSAEQKDTFYGWLAPDNTYKLEWGTYTPKTFTDDDVELDLEACGVCWSDLSTMSDGWGKAMRPLVVGHELVGKVTRVGKNVQHLKVGDRAGCGAQCDCCKQCNMCEREMVSSNQNPRGTSLLCSHPTLQTGTLLRQWPSGYVQRQIHRQDWKHFRWLRYQVARKCKGEHAVRATRHVFIQQLTRHYPTSSSPSVRNPNPRRY